MWARCGLPGTLLLLLFGIGFMGHQLSSSAPQDGVGLREAHTTAPVGQAPVLTTVSPLDPVASAASTPTSMAPTPPRRASPPCAKFAKDLLIAFHGATADVRAFGRSVETCLPSAAFRRPMLTPTVIQRVPRDQPIVRPVEHAVVVMMPLEVCFGNLWHGVHDVLIPALASAAEAMSAASGSHQRGRRGARMRPHLAVSLPSNHDTFWNGECPDMQRWPFGMLAKSSPTAFFTDRVIDGVTFFDWESQLLVPDPSFHQIVARHAALGLNTTCAQFPPLGPPHFFYDVPRPNATTLVDGPAACRDAQRAFEHSIRMPPAKQRGGGGSTASPVARVVYWDREVRLRKNGRHILERDALHAQLLALCPPAYGGGGMQTEAAVRCTTDIVEPWLLSMKQQLAIAQQADVLVAPRGAGTVFTAALKSGAAFVSLFPYANGTAVTAAADNFPWWPFAFARGDVSFAAVACPAVPPINGSVFERQNCKYRSVNFCDMDCDVAKAIEAVEAAVTAATQLRRGGAAAPTWSVVPPLVRRRRVLNDDGAMVDAEGGVAWVYDM